MSSRVQRGVKRVVASLAMEVVLEGVRGYLEEILRPVTPEHLYKAIQEDTSPWDNAPTRVKRRGRIWARKLRKYKDRLTPQLVLEWLQADRPDLHNLIINLGKKGMKWLAKWTEEIKERLWPPGGLKRVKKAPEEEEPPQQPEKVTEKIRYL